VQSAIRLQREDFSSEAPLVSTVLPTPHSESEIGAARVRLQEIMWQRAGLVRSGDGLQQALAELDELETRFGAPAPDRDAIELANMICVARLVVRAALERRESRGAHFRTDFPEIDDAHWQHHISLRCADGQLKIEEAATD
jgi:succinate dehydrogenase/fumarate reductase flavoprotein subunit